jgi:hypothetical protein
LKTPTCASAQKADIAALVVITLDTAGDIRVRFRAPFVDKETQAALLEMAMNVVREQP